MIKFAVAASLAVIVITDAAVSPVSTPTIGTIERPRGLKGDRLPVLAPNTGCADAVRPLSHDQCIGAREQPAGPPPASRLMRTVAAGGTFNAGSKHRFAVSQV